MTVIHKYCVSSMKNYVVKNIQSEILLVSIMFIPTQYKQCNTYEYLIRIMHHIPPFLKTYEYM